MSTDIDNQGIHATASIPRVRLEGTEAGAADLSIRENAGVIEIYDEGTGTVVLTIESHQARHASGGADEIAGIAKAQLAADTIQWGSQIPIIAESPQAGLAADSTGVKWTSIDLVFLAAEIASLKGAYVEASWTASATDSVTAIELYDATAAAVLASVSGNTGTNSRSTAGTITAGNVLNVRVNVTTASATTGATTDVSKAVLVLVFGAS